MIYLIPYKILYGMYIHIFQIYVYYITSYNTQDIHTYARSILFNLNPNPRNLKKEKK